MDPPPALTGESGLGPPAALDQHRHRVLVFAAPVLGNLFRRTRADFYSTVFRKAFIDNLHQLGCGRVDDALSTKVWKVREQRFHLRRRSKYQAIIRCSITFEIAGDFNPVAMLLQRRPNEIMPILGMCRDENVVYFMFSK